MIATHPEVYMQYLEVQGDNPFYSPGNIALAMYQKPDVTRFGTREKWKTMGRSIMDSEVKNGFQIFSRASFGKGFILAPAYDISQTYGREVKAVRLENNTQAMEDALKTVLNYSIVPPVVDESLDSPAYLPCGEGIPPPARRQGRTIAGAIAREPPPYGGGP